MAAPSRITLQDVSGQWAINKTFSDDIDPILKLQGVGWFLRRIISFATVTITLTQYVDDKTVTHIDAKQVITGGIATQEFRILDWTFRNRHDIIFGEVKVRSRWVTLTDIDDDFLTTGWHDSSGKHVQTWAESVSKGWALNQIFGFEVIDGQRYYVTRFIIWKGNDKILAKLVYNHQSNGAES